MFDFALDLVGVSTAFVAPLIWMVGQVVALVVLRGPMRAFAAIPLLIMAYVIPVTYDNWRHHSNLWPLFFIFASFPAAFVVVVALGLAKPRPKLSKRFKVTTAAVTTALVLVTCLRAAVDSDRHRVAEQRQSKEADAIIRLLDAAVPVGEVQSSDPALVDPQAAADVVAQSGVLYNACYRQGLALDPNLGGPLTIELDVGAQGRVMSARVSQSCGAPSVERCIVEALQKLEFERSAPGVVDARTTLVIPMQLRPPSTRTQSR